MDEVLERLSNTSVTEPSSGSGYEHLFKNRGREGSQDERRQWILESQKRQRNEQMDGGRILKLVQAVENEMDWNSEDGRAKYKPSVKVAGFHRGVSSYKNVLMLSEWMVQRPADLHNWYIVPCPKGTRVLLVATKGRTKVYGKQGQFRFQGRSGLPGGNLANQCKRCTVLDCVYYEEGNTMYVLDVLTWSDQPMTECQMEFRQYWLTNSFDDNNYKDVNDHNHFVFSVLPKVPCTQTELNEFMMKAPMFAEDGPPLDGLLLYNKWAHYTGGVTPLVGWLYPFMVNEVLGEDVTVSGEYASQKPIDYTTQAEYIARFEERARGRSGGGRGRRRVEAAKADPATEQKAEAMDDASEPSAGADSAVSKVTEMGNLAPVLKMEALEQFAPVL